MLLQLSPTERILDALQTACETLEGRELLDLVGRVELVLLDVRRRLEGPQVRGVRGLMLGHMRDWEGEPSHLVVRGGRR